MPRQNKVSQLPRIRLPHSTGVLMSGTRASLVATGSGVIRPCWSKAYSLVPLFSVQSRCLPGDQKSAKPTSKIVNRHSSIKWLSCPV